jgi:hypothetical protein
MLIGVRENEDTSDCWEVAIDDLHCKIETRWLLRLVICLYEGSQEAGSWSCTAQAVRPVQSLIARWNTPWDNSLPITMARRVTFWL